VRFQQGGGFNDAGQCFLQAAHPRHGATDMIQHIAEPDMRRGIDIGQISHRQPLTHFLHRANNPFKPAKLAAQAEDAADRCLFGKFVNRPLFHRLNRCFQPVHDRLIAIDDEIKNGMGNKVGPLSQPLGIAFQPAAQGIMRAGGTETDADDEIRPQEQRSLAIGDILTLLYRSGAGDKEQMLGVNLYLGHLRGVERILHCQLVQAKLAADKLHFLRRWIGKADPVKHMRWQRLTRRTIDGNGVFGRGTLGIAARGNDWHGALVAKLAKTGNGVPVMAGLAMAPNTAYTNVSRRERMNATSPISQPVDVLIIGAGISGIGMAARLKADCPQRSFVMLERREAIGGTWDLFRYPGIRSDVDMYTLGFGFQPWRGKRDIADAGSILEYLNNVVDSHGIREHIRFGQTVLAADWDSATALWTLTIADGTAQRARFLFLGAGYYDHDNPHDAAIAGIENFAGDVIHPQFWPDGYDHAGKRVVVIGSGATAVSMLPALAETAAQVTMLQRTPSFYLMRPWVDTFARKLRKVLPEKWVFAMIRRRNALMTNFLYHRCRNNPKGMAAFLTGPVRERLGTHFQPADFTPPYNPFEQRICIVPDGDMFDAIKSGKAEIVTGQIAGVDKAGIVLEDGRRIDADVIVTATGLKIAVAGKIAVNVDGAAVNFADHFYYRNCMFSNVPNLAVMFGYLNAGWTLRVDIVTDWLTRLWNQMDAWKMDIATPYLPKDHALVEHPVFEVFSSGYLQRARALLPKSATTAPWQISMDYPTDRKAMRDAVIDDGVMRFERV
jgi:monooxygenase